MRHVLFQPYRWDCNPDGNKLPSVHGKPFSQEVVDHFVTVSSFIGYFRLLTQRLRFIMPDKYRFEPQDILTGNDFAFRENNEMSNAQANETFIVDARFNRTLGGSGQTMAFAKLQYKVDAQVQQRRDAEADRLEKIVANL